MNELKGYENHYHGCSVFYVFLCCDKSTALEFTYAALTHVKME